MWGIGSRAHQRDRGIPFEELEALRHGSLPHLCCFVVCLFGVESRIEKVHAQVMCVGDWEQGAPAGQGHPAKGCWKLCWRHYPVQRYNKVVFVMSAYKTLKGSTLLYLFVEGLALRRTFCVATMAAVYIGSHRYRYRELDFLFSTRSTKMSPLRMARCRPVPRYIWW